MSILEAIILGLLQGLTEFLPVSSSGHLVLGQVLLGREVTTGAAVEVALHFGTALSIVTVYRRRILELLAALPGLLTAAGREHEDGRLIINLVLGTIPVVLVGLFAKDQVEALFAGDARVMQTGVCLLITGALLALTLKLPGGARRIGVGAALLIGLAQACALPPGISRSGATICVALYLAADRERAGEFSLLLGVIAIIGASVLKLDDLLQAPPGSADLLALCVGVVVSYASGLLAIGLLLGSLRQRWFAAFAPYCAIVGVICLLA